MGLNYIIIPSTLSTGSNNWGLSTSIQKWVVDYSASDYSNTSTNKIPDFVTYIPAYVFYRCTTLTTISIPTGISYLGNYAFYGCSNLYNINFINSNCACIGDFVFDGCSALTTISIPNTVTKIGTYAFSNCWILSNVYFNTSSITDIGFCQFLNCYKLNNVVLPNNISMIDDFAFQNCYTLDNITFSNSSKTITSIGECAFKGCIKLSGIDLSKTINIKDEAFMGCTILGNVTLSNSLTAIGYATFSNCFGMTSVTIPSSVVNIGNFAFYSGINIANITFTPTSNCKSIGKGAFENLKLASIIIPISVVNIGDYAYYGNTNVTSIIFYTTSQCKTIGNYAFGNIPSITNTYFIPTMGIKTGINIIGNGSGIGSGGQINVIAPSLSVNGSSIIINSDSSTGVSITNYQWSFDNIVWTTLSPVQHRYPFTINPFTISYPGIIGNTYNITVRSIFSGSSSAGLNNQPSAIASFNFPEPTYTTPDITIGPSLITAGIISQTVTAIIVNDGTNDTFTDGSLAGLAIISLDFSNSFSITSIPPLLCAGDINLVTVEYPPLLDFIGIGAFSNTGLIGVDLSSMTIEVDFGAFQDNLYMLDFSI